MCRRCDRFDRNITLRKSRKIENASEALASQLYSDSIYQSYAAILNSAKALLLAAQQKTNSHATIINQFDEVFVATKKIKLPNTFATFIYQIQKNEPNEAFAKSYLVDATWFLQQLKTFRKEELTHA